MNIQMTVEELKCLALQQLGLQAEIKRRGGFCVLQTEHTIELTNGSLEISTGEGKESP